MTGHEPILRMRRAGSKPAYVWVSDSPKAFMDGLTIKVHGDNPDMLDLRFLVGVTAIVQGTDPQRVERIATACQQFAKRVIATTHESKHFDAIRVTDTEGVLTWN